MKRDVLVVSAGDRSWFDRLAGGSVDRILKNAASHTAAVNRSSDVVRLDLDPAPGGPPAVFVKCYRYQRLGEQLEQVFRGTLAGKSRARFEYEFLSEMRRRDVAAVRPIAYGEKRRAARLRACFLVTEGGPGFRPLDWFAADLSGSSPLNRRDRVALVAGLGATLRQMHRAGVRHGGLAWRNIVLSRQACGQWAFRLLDPSRRGRFYRGPVPRDAVIADLADFAASGTAVHRRTDITRFFRSYFACQRLGANERAVMRAVIRAARPKVRGEDHRWAVSSALAWLQERVDRAARRPGPLGARSIDSVADFFTALMATDANVPADSAKRCVIHLEFNDPPHSDRPQRFTVTLGGDGAKVDEGFADHADLTIKTDPAAWLAIVNAQPEAFDMIRHGRIEFHGDMWALSSLAGLIDALRDRAADAAALGPPAQRQAVPDDTRAAARPDLWRRQYQSRQHARFYAHKHEATWARRLSNALERSMVERALHRVRRVQPFRTALDCPSGAGRFLPTLARFDASVIAMDTSDAMLAEGRRYQDLFRDRPRLVVGSALAVPLPDRSVDIVLCARLIHHFADADARVGILREFARVARCGVVVSFFDAGSYHGWRRQRQARRPGKRLPRHAMSRAQIAREGAQAGLKLVGFNALLRFHAEVTAAAFVLD